MIGREGGNRDGFVVFCTSPKVILAGAMRSGFEEWECPDEGRATSEELTARDGLERIRAEALPEPYLKGREK